MGIWFIFRGSKVWRDGFGEKTNVLSFSKNNQKQYDICKNI